MSGPADRRKVVDAASATTGGPKEQAEVARSQPDLADAPGKVSTLRAAQLLAANEALVVAALHAESVAEAAQLDLDELARSVQRDAQLEAELAEAQKMEAIGLLAGGIAHDFNNVLAGLLGNLALARQQLAADHPAMPSLQQAEKAGLHGRHLVRQILSFARRQPKTLADWELAPLIDQALDMLRSVLPASVKLEVRVSGGPLHVLGDATQIEQVVMNVCTNAWQALDGQPGCVDVGLEAIAVAPADAARIGGGLAAGRFARLSVSDTGSGMDAATRARLFEPLFTTKPRGKGTGLGLSVAHRIVIAHGGAITVESVPGQGSRFDVYLPLHEPTVTAAGEAEPASAPRGRGEHVLYLDDDEVMLLMVERLLTGLGYQVSSYQSASAAVAAVRDHPDGFDVVVTDFNMPESSGLEVARELARIRPGLPVLITSGNIPEHLYGEARELGVRAVMNKENTLEDLGALLRLILSGGYQIAQLQ